MITHWLDFTAQSVFDIPSFAEVKLYTCATRADTVWLLHVTNHLTIDYVLIIMVSELKSCLFCFRPKSKEVVLLTVLVFLSRWTEYSIKLYDLWRSYCVCFFPPHLKMRGQKADYFIFTQDEIAVDLMSVAASFYCEVHLNLKFLRRMRRKF